MYRHGISVLEKATSITPPIKTSSAVQVIVGTAPGHLVDGEINKPILCYSFKEACEKIGYSEDFEKYTLCQSMYASFIMFSVAPVIFINVLDPKKHIESKTQNIDIVDGVSLINLDVSKNIVLSKVDDSVSYTQDEHYETEYTEDGKLKISVIKEIEDGNYKVQLNEIATEKVTAEDIIGGYDVVNKKHKGLELIKQIYPMFSIVPGQILAPGYSHIPSIAQIMAAKAKLINGGFKAQCLVDVLPTLEYSEVKEWKDNNGLTSPFMQLYYPKIKSGEKQIFMSAIMGALTALIDAQNEDVPYKSPSNKLIQISGTVLEDNSFVYLDQIQGNFLNSIGVNTAININGFRSWGNNTAIYPASSDPKDRFIPIRRMFNWWANTFILTFFSKVDEPTNYRLIENIVDSENIRANGLKGKGQIAGAKIEFRKEDNPLTDILNGKIVFHQSIAAFPPAENIQNTLEFDPTMLQQSLGGK